MANSENASAEVVALIGKLEAAARTAFVGGGDAVRLAVLGLVSGLHVLVEDIPGVGKTTLALALARAAGLDFSRIQFTPDLLPGDVLGMNVWDGQNHRFVFKNGPIQARFVLADEMNRASPRTQSAFLEAMQEGKVSVDGVSLALPEPFFLIATQNPQNFGGTFPLPEAELDRFGLSFSIGYPSPEDEAAILERSSQAAAADRVTAVASGEDIARARSLIAGIIVAEPLRAYIVAAVRATRIAPDIKLGASPRAAVFLQQAGRACAAAAGRDFVIPEDIESIAPAVLAHRVVLSSQARLSGADAPRVIRDVVAAVEKPTGL
jgi:MoxR-like ATPase